MQNGSSWAPVVAALGASIITLFGSFGLFQWQRWRDNRAAAKAVKLAAYGDLHARIFSFARRIDSVGLTKQLRSGFGERLDVALRHRKPLDLFTLYDWMDTDLKPLHDAYAKICAIGTQEAIDIATRLISTCGDLIDSAIATDEQRGYLSRTFRGEVRSEEQKTAYQKCVRTLFEENENLARLIRAETGRETVIFPIQRRALAEGAKGEPDPIGQ